MKKAILFVLTILFFTASLAVSAKTQQATQASYEEQAIAKYFDKSGKLTTAGEALVEKANAIIAKIKIPLKEQLGNDSVNVYVRLPQNKTKIFGVVARHAQITKIEPKAVSTPSYIITTDSETLKEIASAASPYAEAMNAIKSKKIEIKGNGWGPKAKLFVLLAFLKTKDSLASITGRMLFFLPHR